MCPIYMLIEEKERALAGMRNMKIKPDYLLFIDDITDLTYDLEFISDIKVLHTTGIYDSFGSVLDCRFIPLWDDEFENAAIERKRFIDGYEDFL